MLATASAETANAIVQSSHALRGSVDALTAASNQNTEVMSRWAKATARWTMWLTIATIALFLSALVQLVMLFRSGA